MKRLIVILGFALLFGCSTTPTSFQTSSEIKAQIYDEGYPSTTSTLPTVPPASAIDSPSEWQKKAEEATTNSTVTLGTTTTSSSTTTTAPQKHSYAFLPGVKIINKGMNIYVGSTVSYYVQAEVEFAVVAINKYSGSHWTVQRGDHGVYENDVQIQVEEPKNCANNDSANFGCTHYLLEPHGWVKFAEISIAPKTIGQPWEQESIIHELLHVAGLDHVTTDDVMNPNQHVADRPSEGDVAGLVELGRYK